MRSARARLTMRPSGERQRLDSVADTGIGSKACAGLSSRKVACPLERLWVSSNETKTSELNRQLPSPGWLPPEVGPTATETMDSP